MCAHVYSRVPLKRAGNRGAEEEGAPSGQKIFSMDGSCGWYGLSPQLGDHQCPTYISFHGRQQADAHSDPAAFRGRNRMSKEETNKGSPLCGHVLCMLLGMGNDHVYRHRYVPESVLFM